jgi:RNA polymerase sigma-70 factor, ECF subfamily
VLCQEDIIKGLLSDRVRLLSYIRTIVVNVHVAEDIHQEVVLKVLQKYETIADEEHLLAWTRYVAKLRAYDYLRAQNRHPLHLDPDVLDLLEPNWDEEWSLNSSSVTAALNGCMQELSPRSQTLIRLRFTKKMSGRQISEQLGIKLKSVHMALSRIYRTLNDCVKRKTVQT